MNNEVNNCRVLSSLEWALQLQRSRSSSTVYVMLHCHVSTVAQNGQTSREFPLHNRFGGKYCILYYSTFIWKL